MDFAKPEALETYALVELYRTPRAAMPMTLVRNIFFKGRWFIDLNVLVK
jgi:hypothetical protein